MGVAVSHRLCVCQTWLKSRFSQWRKPVDCKFSTAEFPPVFRGITTATSCPHCTRKSRLWGDVSPLKWLGEKVKDGQPQLCTVFSGSYPCWLCQDLRSNLACLSTGPSLCAYTCWLFSSVKSHAGSVRLYSSQDSDFSAMASRNWWVWYSLVPARDDQLQTVVVLISCSKRSPHFLLFICTCTK